MPGNKRLGLSPRSYARGISGYKTTKVSDINRHSQPDRVTLFAEKRGYPCRSLKAVAKYSSVHFMAKLRVMCRVSWKEYILMRVSAPYYLSMPSDSEQLCRVVLQHNCLRISKCPYRTPRPTGDFVCLGWLVYRGRHAPPDWLAS